MSLLKETESNIFFLLVAFLLAFSIYETVGTALGTDTPIVSVISDSMEHEYPSMGRIGEVIKNDRSITDFFSTDIGFSRGDIILVKGTNIENIETGENGDVIVYKSEDERIKQVMPPMIHRAISKTNKTVETMGDNNTGQVKYCVPEYGGIRQTRNSCRNGGKVVEIEKNITESQILGEAVMVLPKIGYAKIIPSCLYTLLTNPRDSKEVDLVCGDLV